MNKIATIIGLTIFMLIRHAVCAFQASPSIGNTSNVAIPNKFNTVMFVKEKSAPKENRKGSPYLLKNKSLGTIYTRNYGNISGLELNYNIEKKEFDIFNDSGVKVLPDIHVDSFHITDMIQQKSRYINLLHIAKTKNSIPILGFAELIESSDDVIIINKLGVKINKPNYNKALDFGEKAEKIELIMTPYVIKNSILYKFPLNKTTFNSVFGDQTETIKKYARQENLKINRLEDFILALKAIN